MATRATARFWSAVQTPDYITSGLFCACGDKRRDEGLRDTPGCGVPTIHTGAGSMTRRVKKGRA